MRAALAVAIAGASLWAPNSAWAEGGDTIATAPPVVYGQLETGNTATGHKYESSCFFGFENYYDQFWALNVQAGDVLTIDWTGVKATALRLYPVGTTDFTVFKGETSSESQELTANLSNQLVYQVPATGIMPLEFAICEESSGDPPGPYSFTATVQHGLSVGLPARANVRTNSVIHGSAALMSGGPVPDGVSFTLTATWSHGSASYTASSVGGELAFTLALPEETEGQPLTLALSRAADATYAAPTTAQIETHVAKPRVEPLPSHHTRHHHRRRHHRHHHHR